MALQGNLRDFSVTEILQLLGTQKKSGCLMLEWNTERAQVFTSDGRIVSTREPGMAADDRLLRFLMKIHRLSDEQRRGLISLHRESRRDLEDLLVNGRYIDAEELKGYLERQILNDLMQMVRWENGTYRFDPKRNQTVAPLVRLSMEGALIEAARRVDEEKRFVARFRDPHQLLGVRDLPDPDEALAEEEKELFGIIDGQHTVAEVVEAAPLTEYETYESLARMLDAQWLEVVGRRDPGIVPLPGSARPVVVRRAQRRLGREILVGGLVLLVTVALQLGARQVRAYRSTHANLNQPFVAEQLRDVRFALDLYHREYGRYPEKLHDLIEDDWIGSDRLRIPGRTLEYRSTRSGQSYELDLGAAR